MTASGSRGTAGRDPFCWRDPAPSGGGVGPLSGWLVAVKDNIEVAGQPCEAGAPLYAGRVATANAPAVRRLLQASACIVGRTRMVELAFGSWGVNAWQGTPSNPWDPDTRRAPGGSSSGSAVAVAARLVRAALGTDTAGSVRMPAALCGVTGFKPSHGLVPLEGVVPLAPSYDSIGPLATTAADCAILHAVLAGEAGPAEPLSGPLRIGCLDRGAWPVAVAPSVAAATDAAAQTLRAAGHDSVCVAPPFDLGTLTTDAGVLIAHEAWVVFGAEFTARPECFGAALHRRLSAARAIASDAVAQARQRRARACAEFAAWIQGMDVLLLPAVPCAAPPLDGIDETGSTLGHFARWVNHVGGCAISLPAGVDAHGLPVAVQMVGRHGADATVLGAGQLFQQITRWHMLAPPPR